MDPRNRNGRDFENDIARLFRVAGYTVDQNVDLGGQEFDIIATRREFGELQTKIAVECKFKTSGAIGNQQVFDFVSAFRACAAPHHLTHGLVVSNLGFSRPAQVAAQGQGSISLITAANLENELLGTRTYLEAAQQNYRSDFTNYVALRATVATSDRFRAESVSDVVQHCAARLSEIERTFTVLLGDFGSGKTTVAEQVHARMSEAFLAGRSKVFPLILYLRTLEQYESETDFIESHLKLRSRDFTIDRLEAVRYRSPVSLLLDGFDEIAANATEEERTRLFSRAMRLASRGHSILLTSRPAYFNNLAELEALVETLVKRDHGAVHRLDGQILRNDSEVQAIVDRQQAVILKKLGNSAFPSFGDKKTEMLVLNPLTKADIIKFFEPLSEELWRISRRTPEQVYDFLQGVYDLTDLLTRPLLLDMFVDLLREGALRLDQPDLEIGPAGLYHHYINYHLERDWGVRRFLLAEERLAFARAAAIAMLEAGGSLEASYESVWQIVSSDDSVLAPERRHLLDSDREGVVTDVRVCSFMNVTPGGRIEFSHKSFMEFFVAEIIVMRLGRRQAIPLLAMPLNYEILYFLGSYALVRSETRLEIVQHLQHVAHGQSDLYRTNLRLALLFSERISTEREFANIEFSRVRIARKGFQDCSFRRVTLHHASLLHSSFNQCEFDEFRVEGEIHTVIFNGAFGVISLPAVCEGLTLKDCDRLALDSASDGHIRVKGGEWHTSRVSIAANISFINAVVRDTRLTVAQAKIVRLDDTLVRDSALLHAPRSNDARRLPKLDLDGARFTNAVLFFFTVTREQFVKAEKLLRGPKGILVIEDSERELQAFRQTGPDGVNRYIGWEATKRLLLISAATFRKLDGDDLERILRTWPDNGAFNRWSTESAVSVVRKVLAKSDSRDDSADADTAALPS